MSNIAEILKLKGDKEFLPINPGIVVEDGGVYKGYDYLITFVEFSAHRNGYVFIPKDNKLHDKKLDGKDGYDLSVHGGITFYDYGCAVIGMNENTDRTEKWVGFDGMHSGDLSDIEHYKKYFGNNTRRIGFLEEMFDALSSRDNVIRTKEYMIQECKNLIDQIIELNKDE
jgi:hypothetical protein